MTVTAERLQVEVGADTSEADRKLSDLGNESGGGRWTGLLKTAGVSAFAAIGAAGVAVVGTGLKVAADMEQADIAFSTMLGSGEKAKVFLDQLKAFAASTPFEFPELQKAASSLISAGVEASKVIPIMTTLGDVTSGMGTGAEGVQRATIALQQMSAAGKITGEDLNQLRDAGVPVFDLLAAATGKSKAEIVALAQAGKLGKKEMDQLFAALESGKGLERFNGLMEKQSKSLTGLLSTLKDTVGQSLAGMMSPVVGTLEKALPQVTSVIDVALKAVGPSLTGLASGVIDALKSILPSLVPILGVVAQTIGELFKKLAPAVAELLPAFLRIMQAFLPVLPVLAQLLVAMAPAIVVLANAFAAILEHTPVPVLAAITAALLIMTGTISPVVVAVMALALAASFIIDHWAGIAGFFGDLWNGIKIVFSAALGFITDNVGTFGRVVLALMTGGLSELVMLVIGHWDQIKGAIGAAVGFITDNIGTLARVMVAILTGGLSEVLRLFIGHWGQIKTAVVNAITTLLSVVRAVPGQIVSALGNLGGLLLTAGKAIIQGLIDGIKAMFGAAVEAVKGVVSGVISAGKKLLHLGSPSRLFFGFGVDTMQGLINGLLDQRGDLRNSVLRALEPLVGVDLAGALAMGGRGGAGRGIRSPVASEIAARAGVGATVTTIVQGSVLRESELYELVVARLLDAGLPREVLTGALGG